MIFQRAFWFCLLSVIVWAVAPAAVDASAQIIGGAEGVEQTAPPAVPLPVVPPPVAVPEDYKLAPGDVLSIWVEHDAEISGRTYALDGSGFIGIPMIGRVQAQGRTIAEVEDEVTRRAGDFIRDPLVVVGLETMRSMQITVLGSVARPGVYGATGLRTLLEVLSEAGGILPEAGPVVRVSRPAEEGPIPHELAVQDLATGRSVVDLSLEDLRRLTGNSNLAVKPGDIVTVEEAQMVYLLVEGRAQGRVPLTQGDSISLVQALVLAGGLAPTSEPNKAVILRGEEAGGRDQHIQVNVDRILRGQESDVQLVANDLLYVPARTGETLGERVLDRGLSGIISGLTWGIFR